MAMRSNNCKQSLLSRAADKQLTAAEAYFICFVSLISMAIAIFLLSNMPSGILIGSLLKRLKIAAQHRNTSLKEVLPYGEGIMGYFYTPRTVQ